MFTQPSHSAHAFLTCLRYTKTIEDVENRATPSGSCLAWAEWQFSFSSPFSYPPFPKRNTPPAGYCSRYPAFCCIKKERRSASLLRFLAQTHAIEVMQAGFQAVEGILAAFILLHDHPAGTDLAAGGNDALPVEVALADGRIGGSAQLRHIHHVLTVHHIHGPLSFWIQAAGSPPPAVTQ